jgi:hypothetical protein
MEDLDHPLYRQCLAALTKMQEENTRLRVRCARMSEELRWLKLLEPMRRELDILRHQASVQTDALKAAGFQKMRSVEEAANAVEKASQRVSESEVHEYEHKPGSPNYTLKHVWTGELKNEVEESLRRTREERKHLCKHCGEKPALSGRDHCSDTCYKEAQAYLYRRHCAHCTGPLGSGNFATVDGKDYHPECWKLVGKVSLEAKSSIEVGETPLIKARCAFCNSPLEVLPE